MLEFEGASLLRHAVVCSLLAKKAIKIQNIHSDSQKVGIQPAEANFLKFIDRLTSGSTLEVSNSNQDFKFSPGSILGGTFSHEVPAPRCVTYIIEAALLLLPFAKLPSEITLVGATQGTLDLSVDTIRTVTCRWLHLFGVECSLRIVRRGSLPNGGGCVVLSVTPVRVLKTATTTESGKVRRVRGIAFGSRVAADLPQRAATAAKGVLLNVLPDVYVVTDIDAAKGRDCGSGYGVLLVAESTSKMSVISQETVASVGESAEDVGKRSAMLLLDQVLEGGCIDAHHQMLVLILMACSPDEVTTIRCGKLSESAISALSLIETFFGVTFALKEEPSPHSNVPRSTVVTCIGANIVNVAKLSS